MDHKDEDQNEMEKDLKEAMTSPTFEAKFQYLHDHDSNLRTSSAQLESSGGVFEPLKNLTEQQKATFHQLQERIVASNLEKNQREWCDDMCLLRYLRAREWNLERAEKMLRDSLKWRSDFQVERTTVKQMESQISHGHMYSNGFDLMGRPIVFLRVHTQEDPHTREQKLKFMVYSLERAIEKMDKSKGVEKMVWVVDCAGYNYKYNGEVKFGLELLSILQNHFPERLGCVMVFDAPFVFKTFWNVVSPFVDPNTKKKFFFVNRSNKKEMRQLLSEYFDLKGFEKHFGGESDYVFTKEKYLQEELKAEAIRFEKLGLTK
eukprot:TRINITY_DN4698_c0_g1_i1.p1 TRINITY_DN4698_c0_g1~~TRINITY_DN4698_c0_g1_i1.p1  ORF type:complete len:348 (+),score=83.74 TRINITY_DN4698_c0_g1_i1:92-1045(+)